jgi:hypothetical protein
MAFGEAARKIRLHARQPVRRKLVEHPRDWKWSSWSHYENGEEGLIGIDSGIGEEVWQEIKLKIRTLETDPSQASGQEGAAPANPSRLKVSPAPVPRESNYQMAPKTARKPKWAPERPPRAQPANNTAIQAAALFSFLKETRGMTTWTARDLARSLKISPAARRSSIFILTPLGCPPESTAISWGAAKL